MDFSADTYLWIKAFHIIAVISWMAGLLYLPRLFVYHCAVESGSVESETFKVMERRLLRAIMNPAMVVSLLLGLIMAIELGPSVWVEVWFIIKIICLIGLLIMHMLMGKWRKGFQMDSNYHSSKFYRYMNEAPTLLMIIIVLMVVVKPF